VTGAAVLLLAQVSVGVEHLHFRTAETALNRGNALGLSSGADLLRGTLSFRGSRGPARGVFRGVAERSFGFGDDETDFGVREAYLQIGGVAGFVRAGKQRLTWGSGFAWNPTNRLEPPKNALNTSLEQKGVLAVRGDWSASPKATLTLVAARVETRPGDLPIDLPSATRDGGAARLAVLVANTDVAATVSVREGRTPLFGLDVARVIAGNVTAHVEAAAYRGSELPPVRSETFVRVAAGLLYTRGQSAFSLEYFHNGEGYGDRERTAWRAGLEAAPVISPAYIAAATVPYAGLGLGRDYLHASWSRSPSTGGEGWGFSLRAVTSITDGGLVLTPGVSYAPSGRVSVHADGFVPLGPDDGEYRLAPVRGGVVTRVKVSY
jgi:hypothetical protein